MSKITPSNRTADLGNDPVGRLLVRLALPTITAQIVNLLYNIVDRIYIGRIPLEGKLALTGMGVTFPVITLISAFSALVGMGGAPRASIALGAGEKDRAERTLGTCAAALWSLAAVLTVLFLLFQRDLLRLFGASADTLPYAMQYLSIYVLGTVFVMTALGLNGFITAQGRSSVAMKTVVIGAVLNTVLDPLFIFVLKMGVRGAALATVIGQGITMAIALVYCAAKKNLALKVAAAGAPKTALRILKIGLAPFGLTLAPNISLVIINRFSVSYGGQEAIAVYACISYIICIVYLLLQGVGDGSQPLMSRFYGAGNKKSLKHTKTMAYEFAMALALIGGLLIYLLRGKIGLLFGSSAAVNAGVIAVMPIFLVSVPFDAITRVSTAAFYATEKNVLSYILTFAEPVLMLVLMLALPPLLGGQIMIWWSTVFAKMITALISIVLTARYR